MATSIAKDASLVKLLATRLLQCAKETFHLDRTYDPSTTFTLGPFDQVVPPVIPTAIVFVYAHSNATSDDTVSVDRLQRALELALDYYPQLTGRFQINSSDNTHDITAIGTGAELLIAQCSRSLESFASPDGRISIQNLPGTGNALLAPYDDSMEAVCRDPLLRIQYTHFACGSVSLGLRLSHGFCDAEGCFRFMHDLAELYRGLKRTDAVPTLARPPQIRSYMSELRDMTSAEKEIALSFQPSLVHLSPDADAVIATALATTTPASAPTRPPAPAVGRIIRFSSSALKELKGAATEPNSSPLNWVSTFDALVAFFHQHIYRARLQLYAENISALSPPDFLTPVNFRSADRLPGLPLNYFPNALFTTHTSFSPASLANAPLWQISRELHQQTRPPRVPDAHHVRQTLRWMAAQPDKSRIVDGFQYGTGSLMLSSWSKFDMYLGMEFEEGERPVIVALPFSPITLMDGLGYFLPTEALGQRGKGDKEAIDVYLALSEPVWDLLERAEEFKRFTMSWSIGVKE